MKENKYDEVGFFEKYNSMNRSKYGLQAAGEWHELQLLLPDFNNKTVLDLGCGLGWHCKYAAANGASSVIGVDISQRMLGKARAINFHNAIDYRYAAMEDLEFVESSFDVILSSLALHYIADFPALVKNISGWLKDGGQFIFCRASCFYRARQSGLVVRRRRKQVALPRGQLLLRGAQKRCFSGRKRHKISQNVDNLFKYVVKMRFFDKRRGRVAAARRYAKPA